jgi:hypothetical protein
MLCHILHDMLTGDSTGHTTGHRNNIKKHCLVFTPNNVVNAPRNNDGITNVQLYIL